MCPLQSEERFTLQWRREDFDVCCQEWEFSPAAGSREGPEPTEMQSIYTHKYTYTNTVDHISLVDIYCIFLYFYELVILVMSCLCFYIIYIFYFNTF